MALLGILSKIAKSCVTPLRTFTRNVIITSCPPPLPKPQHLICFKFWTSDMIRKIICSAINLKCRLPDTRGIKLPTLDGAKVMILQEVNMPVCHLAVSKAATLLGAHDVSVVDKVVWEQDYMGRIFSGMADVIFVSTCTHGCIQRFAEQSNVPVLCMHSRTHASLQALAAIMTILENFDKIQGLNIGYLGPPHPILNSLLLLCPMLDANIKFKCCCDDAPLTPLLYKVSEEMCDQHHTDMKSCSKKEEVFRDSHVIVAGPTTKKKNKLKFFTIDIKDITSTKQGKADNWMFLHVCPRGEEVKDELFFHDNAKTYAMFDNMQYIAAALMVNAVLCKAFDF